MHRNTFLLILGLAVIAALVTGINIGRTLTPQQEIVVPTPTPTSVPITNLIYQNNICGITLLYPSNMTPDVSTTSGTLFSDSSRPNDSFRIICQPGIPGVPLPSEKIETLTFRNADGTASVSAKLYHDTTAKDGKPFDKLLFVNVKKGVSVFIAGYGEVYNKVISSITLQ